MSVDRDRIARNLGVQFDDHWGNDADYNVVNESGETPQYGYRVVGQPEMDDYLASGQIRSPSDPPSPTGYRGSDQIHVGREPSTMYAGKEDPSGPQYVMQIDMRGGEEWESKGHGIESQGAVHRRPAIPLERATTIWGYPNKRALLDHLGRRSESSPSDQDIIMSYFK
jgi:hypothetical protein